MKKSRRNLFFPALVFSGLLFLGLVINQVENERLYGDFKEYLRDEGSSYKEKYFVSYKEQKRREKRKLTKKYNFIGYRHLENFIILVVGAILKTLNILDMI